MAHMRTYGLLVQIQENHGVRRIVARVVYLNDQGDLLFPSHGDQADVGLADFEVSAYIDRDNPHPWGFQHGYTPHHVDLPRAELMARTLRKIGTGLEAAETERGHVHDFADYLFRVAAILRIRFYFLRNDDLRLSMTGQRFRDVQATGVQLWISDQEATYAKNPAGTP